MPEEINNNDYPSNSINPVEPPKALPEKAAEPSKRVKGKITDGVVVKKKKSFLSSIVEAFIGETSSKSVAEYVVYDVMIPAAKNLIYEAIITSVEMRFFGKPRASSSRRESNRSYVSYDSYSRTSSGRDRERRGGEQGFFDWKEGRGRRRFDDVVIPRYSEAEDVLDNLVEVVETYGVAKISDFNELVGINDEYTDQKWGWDKELISRARIIRVDGGYSLDLPRPIALN